MKEENKYQGIWLDRKMAYIFSYNDRNLSTKKIESEIDSRPRYDGEGKSSGRFGDQHLDKDKKQDLRMKDQMNNYLKRVEEAVDPDSELVLFGPADTKNKLEKSAHLPNLKGVVAADKMTKNQMAAWVRDYFGIDH